MEGQSQETLFDQFDDQVHEDVNGLLWLGALEDGFDFCGHRFVMRTLSIEEELSAALVAKEYIESFGQAKAWALAQVGLSLNAVDGDENFCPPIGPDPLSLARARFQYASQWYWPVVEYLYGRHTDLLERQVNAVGALENLSRRGLPTSSLSVDSLTETESLLREVAEEAEEDSTPLAPGS